MGDRNSMSLSLERKKPVWIVIKALEKIKTTPSKNSLHFLSTRTLLKHKKSGIRNTNIGPVSKL